MGSRTSRGPLWLLVVLGEWHSRVESGDNQRYEEHGRLLTLADVVWQFISTLFLINFPDLKCTSQLCVVWQTSKKDLVWTFKSTVHHREWRLVLRRKFKDLYSFSACKVNCAELDAEMQRFNPSQSPFTTVQIYRPRLTVLFFFFMKIVAYRRRFLLLPTT